ncbi:hypothetical protein BGZ74_001876 [Mortierella antarctica]|nr:hypothetical protein BGZ74_001876 [Mortierella antarctica]
MPMLTALAQNKSQDEQLQLLTAVTPTWRAFHGAAIVDTSMVIFGGTTNPGLNPYGANVPGSNDLWVWSTTLRTWSQPAAQFAGTPNNAPAPQKFLNSVALQSQGRMMSLVSNNTPGVTPGNLLPTLLLLHLVD